MGVETESPKRYKVKRASVKVEGMKRHTAGDWTVQVKAELDVELPDGRRIVAIRRALPIRAQQIGRRRNGK